MDIPTDIPTLINPNIQDYVSKSVIYTFSTKDFYIDDEKNILYRFPYSKNTYWTNFKYSCFNITKNQSEHLEIGIELRTTDGYKYTLKNMEELEDKKWYDTIWPIPSIYTLGTDACIDFKIKPPSDNTSIYNVVISLLGFMDLFPNNTTYLLLSPFNTYQFIFSNFENSGSIYNVENDDYIRDSIHTACIVPLINNY